MIRVTIGLFSSSWKLTVFFFSSQFFCSSNMSNQISRIHVAAKNLRNKSNLFFVQSSLFLRAFVSSLLNKESIYDLTAKPNKRQFVFSSLINAFAADNINSLLI